MANIRVIIDGKIADLPEKGLNLPLTYSIKGRDGMNINTGSRSEYSFELPATKQNDDIFQYFFDPAGITAAKQQYLDAQIEVDGLPFFIGKAQLQSATLRQDIYSWQGKTYKVAFYGNNADWIIQIKELLLKDLGYADHIYGRSENFVAWGNNYLFDEYKYIILKLKDYATFGKVDPLVDSHPALYIVQLLHKIFNSIGYTMNSTFFSTDFAQKLILPVPILSTYLQGLYGQEYLNIAVENTNPVLPWYPSGVIMANLLTQTYTPPLQSPNPFDATTGVYTFPVTGYYLVKCYTRVYDLFFQAPATCCFFLGFVQQGAFPVFDFFWGDCVTTESEFTFERVLYATAGQYISFGYIGGGDATSNPDSYYKVDYRIEVIGEAEIQDGFSLNFRYLMPDWKAIDLIKGLAHAFNLVFETDEGSRIVTIEPSDTYLLESRDPNTRQLNDGFYSKSVDMTPYVDLSKGGELVSDTRQLRTLRLRWKEDSNDPTVQALELNQDLGVHQARYLYPANRYKDGETIIENPFFAPTLVIADEEAVVRGVDNNVTKIPMIPIIWKNNYLEDSTSAEVVESIEPRILVSEANISPYNGTIYVDLGSSTVEAPATVAYMLDYNDTTGFQISLSFADVTTNGFPIAGLMKRFYLAEILRLQCGKYLDIFMYWDALMIEKLSFRTKVKINGDRYILQEINTYNVSSVQSTKTYLKYDFNEPDAENNIQNTIVIGKVNSGGI